MCVAVDGIGHQRCWDVRPDALKPAELLFEGAFFPICLIPIHQSSIYIFFSTSVLIYLSLITTCLLALYFLTCLSLVHKPPILRCMLAGSGRDLLHRYYSPQKSLELGRVHHIIDFIQTLVCFSYRFALVIFVAQFLQVLGSFWIPSRTAGGDYLIQEKVSYKLELY